MGSSDTPSTWPVSHPTPDPPTPVRRRGQGESALAVLLGAWIVAATGVIQAATWLIEQINIIEGTSFGPAGWPTANWINAVLVGAPAILLATLATRPTTRAIGRSWSLAALGLGVIGTLRAIPAQQNEVYLAALAAATALGAAILHAALARLAPTVAPSGNPSLVGRRAPNVRPAGRPSLMLALAAGIAVLVPWLWVGALGGALETALAILAAAGCGWLAAVTLRPIFSVYDGPNVLVPGLAAGVALVPLAAAFAGSGPQLAQMLILPLLGVVAVALARRSGRIRETAALLGAAALGPLAFVEPDETGLVLGFHDVGYWALIGALWALAIAAVLAISTAIGSLPGPDLETVREVRERWWQRRFAAPIALAAAVGCGIVVYPLAGHPGFFGDQLFVVMKQQADLSNLAGIADPVARRQAVYERLIQVANVSQAPLRAELRRDHIGYTPYYLLNGILVDDGVQARVWLSRRSDVDRVLLNPRLRPIPSVGPPLRGTEPAPSAPLWNIALIKAPAVWASGDTGRGIVIGGSDTGVDLSHPALTASYRGGGDSWYDPWNGTRSPVDAQGHGTHTMGSAVGADGIGVAPGAQWMACVNLGRNMANPAYYLDCMQFMFAPFALGGNAFAGDPSRGADIQTNSWGCPTLEGCDLASLEPAVDALTEAGVFFVAAAGNEGPRCGSIDEAPAPYPATFTVGAVDRYADIASFSSRSYMDTASGGKPDLVAPGVDVTSALPGGGYGALDGTSMATPQVAGVVALMWSANPRLRGDVARTADILRATASPAYPTSSAGVCGGAGQVGAGLVNAEAAVVAARLLGS